MNDPLDVTRSEIQDQADNVAAYADTIVRLAGVRDDVGTVYTLRRLLAHTRMLAEATKVLIAETNRRSSEAKPEAA